MSDDPGENRRLWLAERTYSDDEQNIIIAVYATIDGERYHRKERSMASLTGPGVKLTAAVAVDDDRIGEVADPETRERYAAEATRTAEQYAPDDPI